MDYLRPSRTMDEHQRVCGNAKKSVVLRVELVEQRNIFDTLATIGNETLSKRTGREPGKVPTSQVICHVVSDNSVVH